MYKRQDQLCGRVLQIIDKEYMDETLTLQSVSERLHVSASYLGPVAYTHLRFSVKTAVFCVRLHAGCLLACNSPGFPPYI